MVRLLLERPLRLKRLNFDDVSSDWSSARLRHKYISASDHEERKGKERLTPWMDGTHQTLDSEERLPKGRVRTHLLLHQRLPLWRNRAHVLFEGFHDLLCFEACATCDLAQAGQ